jgi:zinc protease
VRHRFDASTETGEIIVSQVLYPGHPAGRNRSLASLSAITRDDIRVFLRDSLSPRGLVVSVAGDIDPATVPAVLAPVTEGWSPVAAAGEAALPDPAPLPPGVYVVDSPAEQAVIEAVAPGMRTTDPTFDPDAFHLRLATCALGEIWVSRLVQRVRVREGLAYSVSAGAYPSRRYPGSVACMAQVDAGSAAYAATVIRDEVARFVQEGPTEKELAAVNESLRGEWIRRFATASDTVALFSDALVSGFPDGFYIVFPDRIGSATTEDVVRAARRYVDPASFRWVLTAPADTVLKPDETHHVRLEDLGPVKRVPLGDPTDAVDLGGLR